LNQLVVVTQTSPAHSQKHPASLDSPEPHPVKMVSGDAPGEARQRHKGGTDHRIGPVGRGEPPGSRGPDNCYSTMQIAEALYSAAAEHSRLARARAERIELENLVTAGRFISVQDAVTLLSVIFQSCRSVILTSELPAGVADDLIRNLHDVVDIVPKVLEGQRPTIRVNGKVRRLKLPTAGELEEFSTEICECVNAAK